jgi:hypothetical protein
MLNLHLEVIRYVYRHEDMGNEKRQQSYILLIYMYNVHYM